jgi:hypothetical protein
MTRRHTIATVLLLSSAAATAAASPAPPPPDAKVSKELLALRGKLLRTPPVEVRSGAAKFRALCDEWGYPLVGNVASKGDVYQPSELCADVRRSEKKGD